MSRASDQIASSLGRLIAIQGIAITYARGESSNDDLDAIPQDAIFEIVDDDGIVTRLELRDYLIVASHLELDETTVQPARGDLITEGDEIYEVMDLPGQGPWGWDDDYKTAYRIHTKHRGAAS